MMFILQNSLCHLSVHFCKIIILCHYCTRVRACSVCVYSVFVLNFCVCSHYDTQRFHVLQRVDARGQDEEHGRRRAALSVGLRKFCLTALCVLHAKLFLDKIPLRQQKRHKQETIKQRGERKWKFGLEKNVQNQKAQTAVGGRQGQQGLLCCPKHT